MLSIVQALLRAESRSMYNSSVHSYASRLLSSSSSLSRDGLISQPSSPASTMQTPHALHAKHHVGGIIGRLNPYLMQNIYSGFREFSKSAPAEKGGAGSVSAKRPRRSYTRLFACRNDRFRSAFEQIWPTLKLTEAEQNLFKRNSRMFVVETGRAISLSQKFNISRPTDGSSSAPIPSIEGTPSMGPPPVAALPLKPHYAQARSALFESDMHLDASGEHPRYLKIRKIRSQFGVRLQNIRKVRLLLGFARRGYLQKLYEQSQVQPGSSKVWKLVCAMESRLGMFALRMGLAHDILAANVVLRRKIFLNGTPPTLKKAYFMQPGDVVSPAPSELSAYKANLAGEMGSLMGDVHRDFLG